MQKCKTRKPNKRATAAFGDGASTSEAAEIAGISVGEIMDLLIKRGLQHSIMAGAIKGSLDRALKAVN